MGFLSGRITFERFRVGGRPLSSFDARHVEIAESHAIGKVGAITADGIEIGFTAGDHILDVNFGLEKNLINDALQFAFRVDVNKVPADLLKAYTQMELSALAADNPSGHPSRLQRQQAREAAEERLREECQNGRFRKMKQFPVLWDARQNLVYFGSSSLGAMERFLPLFKEAFGRSLERITCGVAAASMADERGQLRSLEDVQPTAFTGPKRNFTVAWVQDQFGSRDFLGNEFLLWLWWVLETKSDAIELSDKSTATCMMNRTLALECPLAETGKETITSEKPTALPEAKRAVLAGKLPRKTGLVVVRHDEQYELTLQAETLAVSGAMLPKLDSEPGRPEQEDRIDQIRHLSETIDLLFDAFCRRRLSDGWSHDRQQIKGWLEEKK